MIKINIMPSTLLILVFSWLLAIFGCAAGGAVIILQLRGHYSWIIGILISLTGLLLSLIMRMFGNMGQLLFDIRASNYNLCHLLSVNFAEFSDKFNNIIDINIKIYQDLPKIIKVNIESQTESLNRDMHEVKESINKVNISLCEDIKNQLNSQFEALKVSLQGLSDIAGQVNFYAKSNNDVLSQINQDLKGNLGDSLGQINFYSKFINENINSIKEFFAQIEKNLDLKK